MAYSSSLTSLFYLFNIFRATETKGPLTAAVDLSRRSRQPNAIIIPIALPYKYGNIKGDPHVLRGVSLQLDTVVRWRNTHLKYETPETLLVV